MDQDAFAAFGLDGRVAVVTGAASGIGRAAAVLFARAGARLVLADIAEAGLAETARLIAGDTLALRVDVSRRDEIDGLARAARERFGRIDVWANVAGITDPCPMLDLEEDRVDRLLAINLKGVLWGAIAAARAMREHGAGSIINMSSNGAIGAPPNQSIYAIAKAGVNAITRNLASEVGRFGIRVNTISPGYVETPLGSTAFTTGDGGIDPERRAQFLTAIRSSTRLDTTGVPDDIAHAMLYLASDASRYVTGHNLYVNGGVSMA